MLFFVKARLDVNNQTNDLDLSAVLFTFYLEDDPATELSVWEARDTADFHAIFLPHRPYYAEVLEITPVVEHHDAMRLLTQRLERRRAFVK